MIILVYKYDASAALTDSPELLAWCIAKITTGCDKQVTDFIKMNIESNKLYLDFFYFDLMSC